MLVQVMILDNRYNLALNELKSIESIRYLPGTISTLLTLYNKQYKNEDKRRFETSKLMEECLDYYNTNPNALNDITNGELVVLIRYHVNLII